LYYIHDTANIITRRKPAYVCMQAQPFHNIYKTFYPISISLTADERNSWSDIVVIYIIISLTFSIQITTW